jgi:cytoskeletal protein RodZ
MSRDTLKTLAGMVIIALIVVGTFMYGKAQRDAQLKRDQTVKEQTASTATVSPSTSASTQPSVKPSATPTATPTPKATATPAPTPKATVTPTPTPAVAGAVTTMPETGAPVAPLLAGGAMGLSYLGYLRSRKAAAVAQRRKR